MRGPLLDVSLPSSVSPAWRRTVVRALWALCAAGHTAHAQEAPRPGSLHGVVYDSTTAQPLANALVQVLKVDRSALLSAQTDARGRVMIDSLTPGTWIVAAIHPRLDTLGIEQLSRGVTIEARRTTKITLSVPSARTMITKVCSAAVADDSSGYVRGVLTHVSPIEPAGGGSVRFSWAELVFNNTGVQRLLAHVDAAVDETGRYIACGVPPDVTVRVRAWRGADSTGLLEFDVPPNGLAQLDLAVGASVRVKQPRQRAANDTAATVTDTVEVLRGVGRLAGEIRDPAASPARGVRVTLWGTAADTRTRDDGRFELANLPLGSQLLDLRAIGFEPMRRIVEVQPDGGAPLTVNLSRLMMLDTVKVRALREQFGGRDEGFELRRRRGFGQFIGPEQLEANPPIRTTDLFMMVPGLTVTYSTIGGERVQMRSSVRGLCDPDIYVDRMRLPPDFPLDLAAPASQIRGVEVYRRGMEAPPEFARLDASGCGVIVIWTAPRAPKPPRG